MACDLYCCLLPQCEALRTCRSGFPIVNRGESLSETETIVEVVALRNYVHETPFLYVNSHMSKEQHHLRFVIAR